jgi:hypothetical protein
MNRREFLETSAATLGAAVPLSEIAEADTTRGSHSPPREVLPNGIRLPSPWPPKVAALPRDPVTPPYLKAPPAVIPIDLGRQLLVDDFLIQHTTLKRTFHRPRPHPDNPLVKPDRAWEKKGRGPMAMVFSDGVWFDPKDRLFKMWYMGGYCRGTCYAFSRDGVHWTKPLLDVRKGTNIVHPEVRDSAIVWLDLAEKDPKRRYKLFRSHAEGGRFGLSVHFSADGIHWSKRVVRTGPAGDRTTVFWNPFLGRWVFSLRTDWNRARARRYWESPDLVTGPAWKRMDEAPLWTGSDRRDLPRKDLRVVPQLYNLDAVAYESLILGLFTIWRGDRNIPPGRPKVNEVCLGFSRDGFHWHRPDRGAFLPVSEKKGDWNWGNVQSAGGCCLVVGDKLYFYFSGRAGVPGKGKALGGGLPTPPNGNTGLAVLRRDGFASLDAGQAGGTLTTRPVRFRGKHLFVNAAVAGGELTAEVLDERDRVVPGLARADCVPLRADKTLQEVTWKRATLAVVAGKAVQLRFHLKSGQLYSFWVSAGRSGPSRGSVAAGGPGFTGPTDSVGRP